MIKSLLKIFFISIAFVFITTSLSANHFISIEASVIQKKITLVQELLVDVTIKNKSLFSRKIYPPSTTENISFLYKHKDSLTWNRANSSESLSIDKLAFISLQSYGTIKHIFTVVPFKNLIPGHYDLKIVYFPKHFHGGFISGDIKKVNKWKRGGIVTNLQFEISQEEKEEAEWLSRNYSENFRQLHLLHRVSEEPTILLLRQFISKFPESSFIPKSVLLVVDDIILKSSNITQEKINEIKKYMKQVEKIEIVSPYLKSDLGVLRDIMRRYE